MTSVVLLLMSVHLPRVYNMTSVVLLSLYVLLEMLVLNTGVLNLNYYFCTVFINFKINRNLSISHLV